MNSVAISGRLTAAPEVRTTKNGKTFLTFTVEVPDSFREGTLHTFSCLAFGKAQERLGVVPVGSLIGLSGSLQSREYQGKRSVEVVVDRAEVIVEARSAGSNESARDDDDPFGDD